jgi:hypothetical protein
VSSHPCAHADDSYVIAAILEELSVSKTYAVLGAVLLLALGVIGVVTELHARQTRVVKRS